MVLRVTRSRHSPDSEVPELERIAVLELRVGGIVSPLPFHRESGTNNMVRSETCPATCVDGNPSMRLEVLLVPT